MSIEKGEKKMHYPIDKEHVKMLGRTLLREDITYLGYSGSGIAFECHASKIEVVLWSDSQTATLDFKAIIAIQIEGEPLRRITLEEELTSYVIYEGKKRHMKVKLIKLSEAAFSKVGIKSLKIEGERPYPVPKAARHIEYVGDSITCGYGIEGVWEKDHFTTSQENPLKAYTTQVARHFDADLTSVCWSGIGVISSWTDTGKINDDWLMPDIYEYTDIGLQKALGDCEYEKWDFKGNPVDLVVLHLGTNDASYTRADALKEAQFGKAYYHFVETLRQTHPTAYILCTLGVMGQDLYSEVEKQVALYNKVTGDLKVRSVVLDVQQESDGIGTDWHPSLITHRKIAKTLIEAIETLPIWK